MAPAQQTASQFDLRRRRFLESASSHSGFPDISRFLWYHTIDLGGELVTPGVYDYRETIGDFHFPEDLRGKSALDIGSATGFFAFEFERRGAIVTSVELPSLDDLDRFPGQTIEQSIEKIQSMMSSDSAHCTPEQLYWYLLEGPFGVCAEKLQSNARRCYSTVYDLSLEKLGTKEPFDLVFAGDVLLHTIDPFRALAALVPLCKERLILAQTMPEVPGNIPALVYVGGDDPAQDAVSWWHPTKECFLQLLKKLGFRDAFEAGKHRGVFIPTGDQFERTVLHALR